MQPSVLIVDDDEAVGTVLSNLLRQADFNSRSVHSAAEALRALAEGSFDLVVTDLKMPGMGGFGLLEALQRLPGAPPVVLLTAHGTIPLAVEAMRKGAADFLVKPFDRVEVVRVINQALGNTQKAAPESPPTAPRTDFQAAEPRPQGTFEQERQILEYQQLVAALDRAENNRTIAAQVLGVSRRTLYNRLRSYGLL
jgi:DNA-binding NtrC family response regulator